MDLWGDISSWHYIKYACGTFYRNECFDGLDSRVNSLPFTTRLKASRATATTVTLNSNDAETMANESAIADYAVNLKAHLMVIDTTQSSGTHWNYTFPISNWDKSTHKITCNVTAIYGWQDITNFNLYICQEEGLPNITGSGTQVNVANNSWTGAMYVHGLGANIKGTSSGFQAGVLDFDASKSDSIYGNSSHVTPKNMTMRSWIRDS